MTKEHVNMIQNKDSSSEWFLIEGILHNQFIAVLSLAAFQMIVKDTYTGRFCSSEVIYQIIQ